MIEDTPQDSPGDDDQLHDPDEELHGPDDEELADQCERDQSDSLKFEHFVEACPACSRPVNREMDSCPYCGDILFRSLRDGTFVPRKGLWAKIFAVLVVLLIILGIIMFIWAQIH